MSPKINLIIDIVAAVVYIIAANPLITGLAVHEWVSLGLILVLVVHTATHADWIVAAFKKHASMPQKGRLALDIVSLIVFMVVTVSGIMVSRYVLPLFGFVASGYFIWEPLHAISAKLLLALLLVHIAVNWRWIVSLLPWRATAKKEKYD